MFYMGTFIWGPNKMKQSYSHFAVFYFIFPSLEASESSEKVSIISCAPCSDLYYLSCFSNERNNWENKGYHFCLRTEYFLRMGEVGWNNPWSSQRRSWNSGTSLPGMTPPPPSTGTTQPMAEGGFRRLKPPLHINSKCSNLRFILKQPVTSAGLQWLLV